MTRIVALIAGQKMIALYLLRYIFLYQLTYQTARKPPHDERPYGAW